MDRPTAITGLLIQWTNGDQTALDELVPRVHRELRRLAQSYLRRGSPNQTLQPTALINEAWLRLIDQTQPVRCESRAHFYGIAARLMRMVLVDYSRARRAAKRGGAVETVTLSESMAASDDRLFDVLDVNAALDRLAQIDERKAKVIELRYFGGMNREEISTDLGLTLATVKRDLRLGEAWLRRFLLT
jgi:RNA polymerase sigma factor (TIGR02999 family)